MIIARELEAFCKTTTDQRNSDRSKGQLEHAIHEVGYVLTFAERGCNGRSRVITRHEQLVERAYERCQCITFVTGCECTAVTVRSPRALRSRRKSRSFA